MKRKLAISMSAVMLVSQFQIITMADMKTRTTRIKGDERYDTSVQVSKKAFEKSEYVVLASGEKYQDALCGSVLAGYLDAPILLTKSDNLSKSVSDEIVRLGAKKVYILGGEGTVSKNIQDSLSQNLNVERISGKNRYETSMNIARLLMKNSEYNNVAIANGNLFSDALSAAPAMAKNKIPIILTDGKNLPDIPKEKIKYIIGGEKTIDGRGLKAERISGRDRYETSVKLAEKFFSNTNHVIVTSGQVFPDALSASIFSIRMNAPIILTNKNSLPTSLKNSIYLKDKNITVVGGNDTISPKIENEIKDLSEKKTVNSQENDKPKTDNNYSGGGSSSTKNTESSINKDTTHNKTSDDSKNIDNNSKENTSTNNDSERVTELKNIIKSIKSALNRVTDDDIILENQEFRDVDKSTFKSKIEQGLDGVLEELNKNRDISEERYNELKAQLTPKGGYLKACGFNLDIKIVGDKVVKGKKSNGESEGRYIRLKRDNGKYKFRIESHIKNLQKDDGKDKKDPTKIKNYIKLNFVTASDFNKVNDPNIVVDEQNNIDVVSNPTLKYKKSGFSTSGNAYTVEKVDGGYEVTINYMPDNVILIKPVIKEELDDGSKLETGSLIFIDSLEVIYGQAPVQDYGYNANVAVTVNRYNNKIVKVEDNKTVPMKDGTSPGLWIKSLKFLNKIKDCTLDMVKALRTDIESEHKQDAISGATYSCDAIKKAVISSFVDASSERFVVSSKNTEILVRYEGDPDVVRIPDGITNIEEYSFNAKDNLKKIIFNKNVTNINPKAFKNCNSLVDFEVDSENPVFYSENGVVYRRDNNELVVFPCGRKGEYRVKEGITSIGDKAFFTTDLSKLYIPKSVVKFGEGIVDFAENLSEIDIDAENPEYTSEGAIVYNKNKTKLVFVSPGIEGEYTLPENLTSISTFAFYSCTKLTKINLPENLEHIPTGMFAGCSGLKEIHLPSGLKVIDDRAFVGCSGLESINLPDSLESISTYVFTDSNGLKNIFVGEGSTHFKSVDGVLFSKNREVLYAYPIGREGDYNIPEGVKEIKDGVFYSAMGLGRVVVPDSVKEIGMYTYAINNSDRIPKNLVIVASENSPSYNNAKNLGIPCEIKNSTREESSADTEVNNESSNNDESGRDTEVSNESDNEGTSSTDIGGSSVNNEESSGSSSSSSNNVPKGTWKKVDGIKYKVMTGNVVYVTDIDDDNIHPVIADTVDFDGVELPVVQVNTNVLGDISNAETLTIGRNVRKIMDVAFLGASSLKTVTIGSGVEELDYSCFNNCTGLENIIVDTENKNFISKDGVLYKKEGDNLVLLRYPSSKKDTEYRILKNTIKIETYAFQNAKNLKKLYVPDSVREITDCDAFYRPKRYEMLEIIGSENSYIHQFFNEKLSGKSNISFKVEGRN